MQERPDEMVGILSSDMQLRTEPNFSLAKATSTHMGLAALRAFWPMSSVDYTAANQGRDIAGSGYHLTNSNISIFGYDNIVPYVEFNGTNQWLYKLDGGAANWADIIGTEAYVGQPGLTFGGWFYFDAIDAAAEYVMAKEQNGAGGSYVLYRTAGAATMNFHVNFAVGNSVTSSNSVTQGQWNHIVGRFVPSTTDDIYVNGTKTSAAHAVAAIADTAYALTVGADSAGNVPLDGKASLCFLCAAALSDALIWNLYEQTKTMYGL
jgi:hypothetical protein